MEMVTVTVDPDGRVRIPGTQPGQTITIHLVPDATTAHRHVSKRSPEEWERIKQEILEAGRRNRAEATPEEIERAVNHGDWLYGADGLPR